MCYVRSNTKSAFQVGSCNTRLLGAVALSTLQIAVTIPGLSNIFKIKALEGQQWLIVIALSLAPLLIVEAEKMITSRFSNSK